MLRAFVIQDSKNRFRDLEDVVKIARALGKQAFRVEENVVRVLRVWGPDLQIGYVVVVEVPDSSCSKPSGVEGSETKMSHG